MFHLRGDCVDGEAAKCGATLHYASWKATILTIHWEAVYPNYPLGSAIRAEKARGLKAASDKQQSFFFNKPSTKSRKAAEASFRVTHFLVKKKDFTDGDVFQEVMMIVANTVSKMRKTEPI